QRPQLCLIAGGKGGNNHLEGDARSFDKMRRIEFGVGAVNAGEPGRDRIARRLARGRRRDNARTERDDFVGSSLIARWLGLPQKGILPAPLLAGAEAEHAAPPSTPR